MTSNKLSYFLLFLLATASFPIIAGWIPQLQKIWIVLVCIAIVLFVITKKVFWGSNAKFLCAYAIVVFVNAILGDAVMSSIPIAIVEVLFLYVPTSLTAWAFSSSCIDFVKKLLIISICFYLIELVCSFILVSVEPGIIRRLYYMSVLESNRGLRYVYYKMGLLDYSMAHAMPMLIPALFYAYKSDGLKHQKRLRLFVAFLIIVCVLLTWLSDSTTALMISVLCCVLGLLTNTSGLKNNITKMLIVLCLTVPVILSDDVQLIILDTSESILGSESAFADKIDEFRYSIMNDDLTGDMQGRVDRYSKSLTYFIQSPIWGTNQEPGNHAALLDRLAVLGLLGFIPLLLFFKHSVKNTTPYLSSDSIPFYYEGLLAGLLMLLVKGMWVWPMFFVMFLLLPFILYFVDHKQDYHA